MFINRVNELSQEFYFAHPPRLGSKVRINNIFNSYFYGSPLWDLFGKEADRLDKTWNVSQRILLGLPRQAHRYFIEPLSGGRHIKFLLYERFIKFVESIKSSKKKVLRKTMDTLKRECRSTTGRNMRNLMKLTGNTSVDDLVILEDRCTTKSLKARSGESILLKDLINWDCNPCDVDLAKREVQQMMQEVTT